MPFLKGYRFKGRDWSELAVAFGKTNIKSLDNEPEEKTAAKIHSVLSEGMYVAETANKAKKDEVKKIARICRRFLHVLAKKVPKHEAPLWEGLVKCEDWTLLKYCSVLLKSMWS